MQGIFCMRRTAGSGDCDYSGNVGQNLNGWSPTTFNQALTLRFGCDANTASTVGRALDLVKQRVQLWPASAHRSLVNVPAAQHIQVKIGSC